MLRLSYPIEDIQDHYVLEPSLWVAHAPAVGCRAALLLPACITKRDAPNGTEI